MRSLSVAAAVALTVLAAAGAIGCYAKMRQLRSEASWLLERGSAQGQQYADTFDDAAAEQQLATLKQRRAVLDRVALWQRGQLLLILLAVISAFCSYFLYLFARLRAALEEANAGVEQEHLNVDAERLASGRQKPSWAGGRAP
ncbi:MAG: hypothetical protein IRZ16_18610 [Myxococcaceae bacterium]|nr:hypothetical protein [Myxococcaceae bacterium]